MRLPSYYTRLGIKRTASPDEIRRAFRRAVKRLPPTGASEHWREILEAYAVLRDPTARRRYDARRRGRAWGRQIAARLPKPRGSPSTLNLVVWFGLATSCWVMHRLTTRRKWGEKSPPEPRPIALPATFQNHQGTAVDLLDAFLGEVRRLMDTEAPPEELGQQLSALLATYRGAATSHVQDVEPVTIQISEPYEDGNLDALAFRMIWGVQTERVQTRMPADGSRVETVEGESFVGAEGGTRTRTDLRPEGF